jgi:ligand-binding sensor domain-containing protein/signal transduction histidine kinase
MRPAAPPSNVAWLAFQVLCVLLWSALPARAERFPIRVYTTTDGLAHDTIYKIVRDSRGFLWFCTFDGLSRFDGYGFTTYGLAQGLPNPVIRDLLDTHDGQYWVATHAGLCRFNPNGVPRRSVTTPATQGDAPPPMFVTYSPGSERLSKVVTSLVQDRAGRIWCGTLGGLYRLEQQDGRIAFRRIPAVPSVRSMVEDRRRTLWLGSIGAIYRLLANDRVERYPAPQGLQDSGTGSLLEDHEGRLWAATTRGLWHLVSDPDPAKPVVARAYSRKDGLPTDSINELFQASDGSLWAGTDQGLVGFVQNADRTDSRFRTYAEPQGLRYPLVHSVAEDPVGNLWVGTSGGAARFAPSGITVFDDADGVRGTSSHFTDRVGDLIVVGGPLSRNFISRFDGERFTAILPYPPRRTSSTRIWQENHGLLQDHTGEWWVATRHGLYRYTGARSLDRVVRLPPKAVYTTRDGLASNDIQALFEDSRGDIWVSALGGLSRWNRASETFHRYDERDGWLWRFPAASFAEDGAGDVWIGLWIGGGLVRFREGRFTRFTEADGLADGGILQLFVDSSGRLWVPISPGGVCRIDHPEAERPTIVSYTTSDGLAANDVEAVTEDRRGRIYLASTRGIDRLDPATGRIRHYDVGALRAGVNAALQDRDGALWFRYDTGLVRLVPEPDRPAIPPPVLITTLRIAGDPQPISALGQSEVAALELPATRNRLQIDYVAPGLSPGDGSHYEFKLEGASNDWSGVGEQRTVNFARLGPGRYRFLVRAISADGVSSERPASFAFVILPPLWQRWWSIAAAAVGLMIAGYVVHRYRVARLLEIERVRTHIAADLHDDIGSSLSQIAVLSEVLRTQLGTPEAPISRNLSLINHVSQDALDSMSDIVWAINPRQDHLSDLVRRMRRVASEMLPARNIEFTFDIPPAGHDLTLGADTRRQVFLMFKEAMNNVIRHSRCTRADIELKLNGPWLTLAITDNGRGFDPDRVSDGNGLVSMSRRARALGGETVVSSGKGRGTTITIRIPHGRQRRPGGGDRLPPRNAPMAGDRGSALQ